MKTLICTALMVLFVIAATSCAAKPATWETLHPEVIATSPGMDAAAGYTQADIDSCQVIVASNAGACDPDGDIANGNLDAAE